MAEYPTTNLNSELIGAGLNPNSPATTYTDFADSLAKNRQEQQAQEAAIARARELAKQSKIDTSNQKEAQDAGLNPLLVDSMTPEQAIAYLKIVMKAKGLTIAQEDIDAWEKTLDARVNRQVVENFANRFARETTRTGQASPFGEDTIIMIPKGKSAADLGLVNMKTADGVSVDDKEVSDGTATANVPNEGMYQVIYDNQGNIEKLIPGGKAPVDGQAKADAKQANTENKRWSDLEKELEKNIQSSRGNQLSSAIFRADRALNELADPKTMIPQVLSFIGKDLSGIFQGGVPPVSGMESEDFHTAVDSLNAFVSRYTGFTAAFRSDTGDRREALTHLIVRLRDATLDIIEKMLESKLEGYRDIIDKDPARWHRLLSDKMSAIKAGVTQNAKDETDKHTEFPDQKYEKDGKADKTEKPKEKKQNRLNLDL